MPRNCRVRTAKSLEVALNTRELSLIRPKTIKYSDRAYAALYKLNSTLGFNVEPISVELALQTVQEQSVENKAALGPRYERYVRLALGNLVSKKRSLTKDYDHNDRSKSSTKFVFHKCLIKLFQETFIYGIHFQLHTLSPPDSYRATCGFLRHKLEYSTGKKPSTRSATQQITQLEEENQELALHIADREQSSPAEAGEDHDLQGDSTPNWVPNAQDDVERLIPGEHSPALTEKVSHEIDRMDLVEAFARFKDLIGKRAYSLDPTAEFSDDRSIMSDTNSMVAEPPMPPIVLPTPIRHSFTLNNPKAYPSPESPLRPMARTKSQVASQSRGGTETPLRNTSTAAWKTRAQVP